MTEKPFYLRPPSGRTWFEFARLVEGRTESPEDAYLLGWLDAARSHERLACVQLFVAWLAGCAAVVCALTERERGS